MSTEDLKSPAERSASGFESQPGHELTSESEASKTDRGDCDRGSMAVEETAKLRIMLQGANDECAALKKERDALVATVAAFRGALQGMIDQYGDGDTTCMSANEDADEVLGSTDAGKDLLYQLNDGWKRADEWCGRAREAERRVEKLEIALRALCAMVMQHTWPRGWRAKLVASATALLTGPLGTDGKRS